MAEKFATATALNDGISSINAATEETQTQMKATMDKTIKTAEELVAFGQGNLEAFTRSSQTFAAGVQGLNQSLVASAQAQITEAVEAVKGFAAAKSVNELLSLQAAFARGSLDKAVAETTKLTDASTKLATDVLAPLTARVTLAVDTFGRAA